jgi:FkbM family methyltransferase
MFRVTYDGTVWHVTDSQGDRFRFPFYPYLVFFEIEGYLRQGKWPLEKGMIVIDGGGCFGEFSLYASRKVGDSGRVIMLEPDLANIQIARDYFDFNGGMPANVEIIPAGLWKSSGVLRFASGLGAASSLLEAGQPTPPDAVITETKVESLDSLVEKCNLSRMDLVKLDIEGAELEVADASEPVIRRFRPNYAIASYHIRDGKPTSEKLASQFRKYGYQVKTGFPKHQTTWAGSTL